MISTNEMTSASMDISESFHPEDLSKTDFFDFVNATEIGIGVGISNTDVALSLQAQHHQYQDQQHQHHQQQAHNHARLSTNSNMTHDGGGTTGRSINDVSSNNIRDGSSSDSTLPNYEFWNSDKDNSRLDTSIFEDLDRYCWQQQQITPTSTQAHDTPANHQTANNLTHTDGTVIHCDSSTTNNSNSTQTTHRASSSGGSSNVSRINSNANALNATSVHNNDGQIYTITVLNGGNETSTAPSASASAASSSTAATTGSWLKREPEETQMPTSLDLDSLLGNFSGYIKSEYPYDESGFSTEGNKESVNNDANSISIQQHQQDVISNLSGSGSTGVGQTLPSLATAMSGGRACVNIGQQLATAQFQNNNNDWHMIDHNAEHNSAESLLRSALQGKGYTKGLQHMHNGGIALLPTTSPTNKDEEMRRILFSNETDALAFADSTLNTTQIFEESQHHGNLLQLNNSASITRTTPNVPLTQVSHSSSNLMVDEMFLSLENAFNDDFDKIKRITNEVQQYCSPPTVDSDYISTNMIMQISPTPTTQQLQPLRSPVSSTPSNIINITTAPSSPLAAAKNATRHLQHQQQQQQHHKPEVTTVTTTAPTSNSPSTNNRINATTKVSKKYKRVTNTTNQQTNNNSLNAMNNLSNSTNCNSASNNNNTTTTKNLSSSNNNISNSSACNNTTTPSSGASSSSSSNSPPTSHCNGQRKERSLHYCSICSKGFKDKYSVNVHIRTHTGEKPFACSLCGKSFRQKAHLAKHYQTHMAQKNNHGTGILKSNSSKHHRSTSATTTPGNSSTTQQQRQLSMLTTNSSMPSPISLNTGSGSNGNTLGLGIGPNLLGVTSTVVTLNGTSSSASLTGNILSPPNSIIANR